MKRLLLMISLVSVLLVVMVPVVKADTLQINQSSYSYNVGGEFTITPLSGSLSSVLRSYNSNTSDISSFPNSFQTICLETGVYFTPGSTYSYTISDWAIKGNLTPSPSDNQLTQGASWLYYEFATGQLADYT